MSSRGGREAADVSSCGSVCLSFYYSYAVTPDVTALRVPDVSVSADLMEKLLHLKVQYVRVSDV